MRWLLVFSRITKNAAHGGKALGGILVGNQCLWRLQVIGALQRCHGPGRPRAEKGAADGGTVHACCAGQPGSVVVLRHNDVKL